MADCIGPAKEQLKIASLNAPRDLPVAQPQCSELLSRDHSMLSVGQCRNGTIDASRVPFAPHGCIRHTGVEVSPLTDGDQIVPGVAVGGALRPPRGLTADSSSSAVKPPVASPSSA